MLSAAIPTGEENQAPVPVPSRLPRLEVLPASVVTVPSDVIFRIVPLPVSAT